MRTEPPRCRGRWRRRAPRVTGIGVDDEFTVFGAGGALLFMLLSGLLLARHTPGRPSAA